MSAFFDEIHARYSKPAEFVKRARAKMALHGLTLGAVAARSGFQATHVSKWLNGRVKPGMDTMVVLDEAIETLIQEG
jgi:transcriptional regulator with XRE-family HTH domain